MTNTYMANFDINLIPRHVAVNYLKIKSYASKIQRTASTIGFIRKSLHNNIVPTFAKVKGQFIDSKDQIKVEEGVLRSHLLNHKKNLQYLLKFHEHLSNAIFQEVDSLLYKSIKRNILLTLHSNNLLQLQCKKKKLHKLISSKKSSKKKDSYTIQVINLSSEDLDTKPLKDGLHHNFTDKKKYIKRRIAVELKSLATSLDKFLDHSLKELFHEYLQSSTNILVKYIYSGKDTTFKSLNS